jgi:hypothetical protein
MSARWELRDRLLVVIETGVTSNAEIEQVFVAGALADDRVRPGAHVLWDARASENLLSSDDYVWRFERLNALAEQGRLSRLAILIRAQRDRLDLARSELPKALDLEVGVFTDEAEALRWLSRSDAGSPGGPQADGG